MSKTNNELVTFENSGKGKYVAQFDDERVKDLIYNVMDDVTMCDALISPYVMVGLEEKLLQHLIATSFLNENLEEVKRLKDDVIMIKVVLSGAGYNLMIANKPNDLGGIVYTLKSLQ